MMKIFAEWIPFRNAYRFFSAKAPGSTICYADSLEEVAGEGYDVVLVDTINDVQVLKACR